VDENIYITVFSREHRFYILGSFVCPNRLIGAVYHPRIGHGDLHDPLTLILWIFGCGNFWRFRCIQIRSVT